MLRSLVVSRKRLLYVLPLVLLVALAAVLLWRVGAGHAEGVVIEVNSTTDDKKSNDGLCTLREAIIAANSDKKSGGAKGECVAGSGADTIVFTDTVDLDSSGIGTHILTRTDSGKEDASTTGDLDITDDLIIVGRPGVTISGNGIRDRIFHVIDAQVTISGTTIVSGNVPGDGGAIYNTGGELTLTNVTISGNTASGNGGGIYNAGILYLNNSTVTENYAGGSGGGVASDSYLTFYNTIVAGNTAADATFTTHDCYGSSFFLAGPNLFAIGTGCPSSDSVPPVDPARVFLDVLGPLPQSTGDNALVYPLLDGSPAIDAGDDDKCPSIDQRGLIRPADGDGDGQAHCDIGAFEAGSVPIIIRAVPSTDPDKTTIDGRVHGAANEEYTLDFYAGVACDPETFSQLPGSFVVETDETGDVYFNVVVSGFTVPDGYFVVATATDSYGFTSSFSPCAIAGPGNDSWPRAYRLYPGALPATADHYIDMPGQSRWYKFSIEPNSEVIVTLTGLPANYDLTVYKDIAAAFLALQTPEDPLQEQDLLHLGAEFAPGSFSPGSFSPGSFSPGSFSPGSFSPDIFAPGSFSPGSFSPGSFSPGSFSPDIYAPGSFSPGSFSPGSFSPGSFSPGSFSPDVFAPDTFAPGSFSPGSFSPGSFSPGSFSSAQTRSLIGFSAFEGTASEGIFLNTWNNTGDFYVRVSGRSGAYNRETPSHLTVSLLTGQCGAVNAVDLPPTSLTADAIPSGRKTIILTDLNRMEGTGEEKDALLAKLQELAEQPEVSGALVDVSVDDRVAEANTQADIYYNCPYAKNLVADAIKAIIDDYRTQNDTLEYIVIVGNDHVIPFKRYSDRALLGHESNYIPPVYDLTASQASLRLGYVLSQDAYGAQSTISVNASELPVPDLAVGRLVETPTDVITVLDAYFGAPAGVVTPMSALVTGYDFLWDAANAVRDELKLGLDVENDPDAFVDELIDDRSLAPDNGWTADHLRALLQNERYDLAYLAGHFSANSALAADFTTNFLTTDLLASDVDMANAIFYSAGCHSGYNIVNEHGIPSITFEPDWAQAFAQKGATLIAGTGYQYGDTDFIEYSERLYLDFTRQLRTDPRPVSIGKALVAAKQKYLATTPVLRGIHEKALLEATIFGLPMLSVDMTGTPYIPPSDDPINEPPTNFDTDPGATLGLQYADVHRDLDLTLGAIDLWIVDDEGQKTEDQVTANWFAGSDGYVSNPTEPVLPLELIDVIAPDTETVVRGLGFRGGAYADLEDKVVLAGAATTEIRGVHTPFFTPVYYPIRFWNLNYWGALTDTGNGTTQLALTPSQYLSDPLEPEKGTLRRFDSLDFRLYFSSSTDTYSGGSTPALAEAPTIVHVSAAPNDGSVAFSARVVGNPAAGIQEVWVTYSYVGANPGEWQSIDLIQNSSDSTLWESADEQSTLTLPPGTDACDVRYMVQAVNGVGLVGLDTNSGAHHNPCGASPTQPTSLAIEILSPDPGEAGPYGSQACLKATLTSNELLIPNQIVIFSLGSQIRLAKTDELGQAEIKMPLLGLPDLDPYAVRASFLGTSVYEPSSDLKALVIVKAQTNLVLAPDPASGFSDDEVLLVATLTDQFGQPLNERKTVFFVATDSTGNDYVFPVVTNPAGQAVLGRVDLSPDTYSVTGYFNGEIPGVTEDNPLEDDRYEPTISDPVALVILNQAPVAKDDIYDVDAGGTLNVTAPGVLENDSDADGDSLTAILVEGPANGTLTLNTDGGFTYEPDGGFSGVDVFTYKAYDGSKESNLATVTITVNESPCSGAYATPLTIWPQDKANLYAVKVLGVTHPEGSPFVIEITGIWQDEPVGKNKFSPDAEGIGTDTALVRAERDGNGDGRVYHIFFTAKDATGPFCTGEVLSGIIPHDQGNMIVAIDGGALYDSTVPE